MFSVDTRFLPNYVFHSSYPGDWTGWETSIQEHMKMWWVFMKYLLRSLSVVIVLWQGDSVHALFLFTVFVLFPVGLLFGFLEFGWLKSLLVPTDLIFQSELRHGRSENSIWLEALILFSSDYSTADRVGSSASCDVETAPLANQRPRYAVSASFCMWPELWLVRKGKSFA